MTLAVGSSACWYLCLGRREYVPVGFWTASMLSTPSHKYQQALIVWQYLFIQIV